MNRRGIIAAIGCVAGVFLLVNLAGEVEAHYGFLAAIAFCIVTGFANGSLWARWYYNG